MTPDPAPPAAARPPLMSLDEALARVLASAQPALGEESVSTFDADGRVLARDVVAALTVPPLDNSAMDGYAVRAADCASGVPTLPAAMRCVTGSSAPGAAQSAARTA